MMTATRNTLVQQPGTATVAVLGVTPEIIQLPWPDNASLEAFDHSAEMIASLWNPHPRLPSTVRQAGWENLPLPEASVLVAVGDGSLNVLPGLDDYHAVLSEIARVLRPGGLLCLRCFVRPQRRESLESVVDAVYRGEVTTFHTLKWRIAMALSAAPDFTVPVTDIHAAFQSTYPERNDLSRMTGWPIEVINTIDAYQGAPTRYTFPTMAALLEIGARYLAPGDALHGQYELAERCPTMTFRHQ